MAKWRYQGLMVIKTDAWNARRPPSSVKDSAAILDTICRNAAGTDVSHRPSGVEGRRPFGRRGPSFSADIRTTHGLGHFDNGDPSSFDRVMELSLIKQSDHYPILVVELLHPVRIGQLRLRNLIQAFGLRRVQFDLLS